MALSSHVSFCPQAAKDRDRAPVPNTTEHWGLHRAISIVADNSVVPECPTTPGFSWVRQHTNELQTVPDEKKNNVGSSTEIGGVKSLKKSGIPGVLRFFVAK